VGRTMRHPSARTCSARLHQRGEGFRRHCARLGRVPSATTRLISTMGISNFEPIFTLAILPLYASRLQLQRDRPVMISAPFTSTNSGSSFAITVMRDASYTNQ